MPDLQALLDQIENSDKHATPGPWESHFGGNPHHEWLSVEPKTGSRTICTVTDDHIPNGVFIAMARTVLPQLAKALHHILEACEVAEDIAEKSTARMFDGSTFPAVLDVPQIRFIIQDALGADQ